MFFTIRPKAAQESQQKNLNSMLKRIEPPKPFLYQKRDAKIEALEAELEAYRNNKVTVIVKGGRVLSVHSKAQLDVNVVDFDDKPMTTSEEEKRFKAICSELPKILFA